MDVRIAQKGPGRDGGHCRDTRVWHAALSQVQGGPTPRTPGDCAHRFGEVYPPPALPASSSPCASLRRGPAPWPRPGPTPPRFGAGGAATIPPRAPPPHPSHPPQAPPPPGGPPPPRPPRGGGAAPPP